MGMCTLLKLKKLLTFIDNFQSFQLDYCLLIFFQRIRSTVDEREQKQLLMDLDVVMRSSDCPYIVQFFGALFKEVWSGMLLSTNMKDIAITKFQ